MARGRSDTPKSELIGVRLTPALAAALDHIHALDDITPHDFIRQVLEERVQEYQDDPDYQALVRIRERRKAAREAAEAAKRRSRLGVVREGGSA